MAVNIFDKYGIKQVANVYFEALDDDSKNGVYAGDIVLFLDTLKVSTIETTAESTDARGGWGNPKLVSWDYGKEINITLTDALMSLESLRFMMGGAIKRSKGTDKVLVRFTEQVVAGAKGAIPLPTNHLGREKLHPVATPNHPIRFINLGGGEGSKTAGARTQIVYSDNATGADAQKKRLEMADGQVLLFKNPAFGAEAAEDDIAAQGDVIRIFWEEEVDNTHKKVDAVEVTISPDTFPGTYRVVGDTFMRSEKTGTDEAFQFVINKAKVQSNVTLTLEAEGDPSTFEMTLSVLRATNEAGENEMMKLIRYTVDEGATSSGADNDHGSLEPANSGD